MKRWKKERENIIKKSYKHNHNEIYDNFINEKNIKDFFRSKNKNKSSGLSIINWDIWKELYKKEPEIWNQIMHFVDKTESIPYISKMNHTTLSQKERLSDINNKRTIRVPDPFLNRLEYL